MPETVACIQQLSLHQSLFPHIQSTIALMVSVTCSVLYGSSFGQQCRKSTGVVSRGAAEFVTAAPRSARISASACDT